MDDTNVIALSYISQYHYCKRRAGLLLLEQQWADSTDTVKGSAEHRNVHNASVEKQNGKYVISDLSVFSKRLNLSGKCDAVEATESDSGVVLPFLDDKKYALYPIEYKHGRLRSEPEYELQLCAQAMCLEEMYGCPIHSGALFFISSHRRKEIILGDEHRRQVIKIAGALSEMLECQKIPICDFSPKCIRCSLCDICMPETERSVQRYMKQFAKEFGKEV